MLARQAAGREVICVVSAQCEVCGSSEPTFHVIWYGGSEHDFDSLQCAIQAAPRCRHCGSSVLGRPLFTSDGVYCSLLCLDHALTAAAWATAPGEGDLDPVGSTPPRAGARPALTAPADTPGAV